MGGSHENVQDRHNSDETLSSLADFVSGPVKEYEELSPVFVQFLDLVHSVVAQFPNAFEFTEDLLAFVAEHTFRWVARRDGHRTGKPTNRKPDGRRFSQKPKKTIYNPCIPLYFCQNDFSLVPSSLSQKKSIVRF